MITTEQVNAIAAKIETWGVDETTVSALRQQYQPVHFLTNDYEVATGIVVAEIIAD